MDKIPYESGSYYIIDRAYNKLQDAVSYPPNRSLLRCQSKEESPIQSCQMEAKATKECTFRYGYRIDRILSKAILSLINAMNISDLQVAELYKNLWQVELFFKWLKQHLKIKKFWGTTENAVRIQIYAAICAYSLVAIIQQDMELDRSTYEVLQIVSISLTDKTHLKDLFNKTNFKYDKD